MNPPSQRKMHGIFTDLDGVYLELRRNHEEMYQNESGHFVSLTEDQAVERLKRSKSARSKRLQARIKRASQTATYPATAASIFQGKRVEAEAQCNFSSLPAKEQIELSGNSEVYPSTNPMLKSLRIWQFGFNPHSTLSAFFSTGGSPTVFHRVGKGSEPGREEEMTISSCSLQVLSLFSSLAPLPSL